MTNQILLPPRQKVISTTTTNVHTVYAPAPTYDGQCEDDSQTYTESVDGPITTLWDTSTWWTTVSSTTAYYTTTYVHTAYCHYQNQPLPPQRDSPPPAPVGGQPQGCGDCRPW